MRVNGRQAYRFGLALATLAVGCWVNGNGWAQRIAQEPAAVTPNNLLVYLEVRNLHDAMTRWDESREKQIWLNGTNFQQFSNSKIYLKLASRVEQFARSAGFEIDYAGLSRYAGRRSALALYNPSETEFLFITELTPAERMATDLIRLRGRFESRQAHGTTYYINQEGGRTVCYAETGPYFIVATQEGLLADSLRLSRTPGDGTALAADEDFKEVTTGKPLPDARLYMPLGRLVRNPNFRREWLYANLEDLDAFKVLLSDLQWGSSEIKEYRTMTRTQATVDTPALEVSLVERFVPNGWEFVSARTNPSADWVAARMEAALFNPLPQEYADLSRRHPLSGSYSGYQQARRRSVFERQIDETEIPDERSQQSPIRLQATLLTQTLAGAGVRSMVEMGRSQFGDDGFFVRFQNAFVIQERNPLDPVLIRRIVEQEFAELYTLGALGGGWETRVLANIPYEVFHSGALQVAWTRMSGALVLASAPEYLVRIIQTHQAALDSRFRLEQNEEGTLVYYANVDVESAREGFSRLMEILDYEDKASQGPGAAPLFFSGNMANLLETSSRLRRIEIWRRLLTSKRVETVVYHMRP